MKSICTSSPAVVLKLEHYGSLGIVRTLGRMGVRVYGVDQDQQPFASVSRFCKGHFAYDLDNASPRSVVSFLCDIARKIDGRPILIPTSDETATLVADNAEELAAFYRFSCQPPGLVRSLCSKKELVHLGRRHDIPMPEAFFPRTYKEVVAISRRTSFPLVLKGIDGALLERQAGKKMTIVENAKQLLEAYAQMENTTQPNLMIQEYIPDKGGVDWIFNGYFDRRSECLAAFTGRKIRQNPVHTGMTSLGECLWNQDIVDMATYFMKVIGYRGPVDIDCRYDSQTGSYKILDVNPRIGATFRLFVQTNGMDIARAMYLDLTDQIVDQSSQRERRRWIVEDKDMLSCYHYFKEGSLTLRQWLGSLRGIEEAGYFAADDPYPWLLMWKRHFQRRLLGSRCKPPTSKKRETELSDPISSRSPSVLQRSHHYVLG